MDALEEHHATAAIARRELFAALVELNRGDDSAARDGGSKVSAPIGSGTERNARRDGILIRFLPGETGGTASRTRARTILHLFAGRSPPNTRQFHSSSPRVRSRPPSPTPLVRADPPTHKPCPRPRDSAWTADPGEALSRGDSTPDAARAPRKPRRAVDVREGDPRVGFASRCGRARGRPTRVARLRRATRQRGNRAGGEKLTTRGENHAQPINPSSWRTVGEKRSRRGLTGSLTGYRSASKPDNQNNRPQNS